MLEAASDYLLTSRETMEAFKRAVFRLLCVVLFSVLCSIAFLSELGKRVDFGQHISRELDRISVLPVQGAAEKAFKKSLVILQDRLVVFMTLGTVGNTIGLGSIYCEFENSKRKYLVDIESSEPEAESPFESSNCDPVAPITGFFPLNLRSELILMLLMTLCGIVGACGAVLIGGKEKFALRRGISGIVIVGLGAGFFVYLVLKGGRAFFLFNSELSFSVVSNPFPMSLAAALGGMFAKELFEKLDDWIENKLTIKSIDQEQGKSESDDTRKDESGIIEFTSRIDKLDQPPVIEEKKSGV